MSQNLRSALAMTGMFAVAIALPLMTEDRYFLRIGTVILIYWVLIAGLNLLVGYTGLLSIGHAGLLAVGGYVYTLMGAQLGFHPYLGLLAGCVSSAIVGFVLGLPSLRLPGFYFALATLAFNMIVTEWALAFPSVTGGTVGASVPPLPWPFTSPAGQYFLALGFAAFVTWMTYNVTTAMWGRALIALRDNEVGAQSVGVNVLRTKLTVFVFSGATAGVAGGLFAISQSYITPEAFNFDLGLYFFVAIIIGGRGSILGPLCGAILLALLPELFGSLSRYTPFFYGGALLAVVLLVPEGIGSAAKLFRGHRYASQAAAANDLAPDADMLRAAIEGARP